MIKSIYRFFLGISINNFSKNLVSVIEKLKIKKGITLIDVGAAGDLIPRWKKISRYVNYHGFEPDKRSREKLLEKNNTCKSYKIHDKIISNKIGKQKFYLCQGELNSSTFRPNEKINSLYPFSERFKVKDELFLESTTIDNLKFENADFIKLDIQGGELDALIGSKKTLNKTLGLEIEVEFQHIYKNQPLFNKVFEFLASKDFAFIDFTRLVRWERNNLYSFNGQCIWGDSIFLRTPEYVLNNFYDLEVFKNYIAICVLYNKFDFVKVILEQKKMGLPLSKNLNLLERKFRKRNANLHRISQFLKLFNFSEVDVHTTH